MENTKKFSGKAENYSSGRPAYADGLIDMLYETQGFSPRSVIADIGCGTGIFTKQLVERGSLVYGVEPNDDMRRAAVENLAGYENFRPLGGTAEHTTLEENSVDFITAAQAFHWFDLPSFRTECRKILRPDGKVFLIWNMRDGDAEINRLCADIFAEYCPDFKGFSGGIEREDRRISAFFGGNSRTAAFDHPLVYDREKFIRRSLSASYSLTESDGRFAQYLQRLYALFDRKSRNGVLTIPNQTTVYFGKI